MNTHVKSLGKFLASSSGLFVHLLLLLISSAILIYKPLVEFHVYDKGPLLEKKETVYAMEPNSKTAPRVEVGFSLENFSTFDVPNNDFQAAGVVWFIFDPKEITLEKLEDFSFNKTEIQFKSKPVTHAYGKNKTLARYFIRLKFVSNLDYRDFPLDDHRIFLVLKNDQLSSKDVEFISSKNNLYIASDHMHHTTWKLTDHNVTTGYDKITLHEHADIEELYYPNVVFSLDYERIGIHLIMLILIPLLFVFFVSLSIFFLQTEEVSGAYRGVLFSLVGFLFVLETLSPPVGYLTLSDYIYFGVFFWSFLLITLAWEGKRISHVWRGLIGTAIEMGLIAFLFFIFHIWR